MLKKRVVLLVQKSSRRSSPVDNNASGSVIGIGSIKLRLYDGAIKTLSNVRHALELKRTLIL